MIMDKLKKFLGGFPEWLIAVICIAGVLFTSYVDGPEWLIVVLFLAAFILPAIKKGMFGKD